MTDLDPPVLFVSLVDFHDGLSRPPRDVDQKTRVKLIRKVLKLWIATHSQVPFDRAINPHGARLAFFCFFSFLFFDRDRSLTRRDFKALCYGSMQGNRSPIS